jgi:[ribosomal protein S5]-alanine N-acetyltransferase
VNALARSTPRLHLRELDGTDLEALHALESDPEMVRYQAYGVRSLADCRQYLDEVAREARRVARRIVELAVVATAEHALIGRTGLARDEIENRASIWYAIRRDRWGQGLATESVAALCDLAFDELGLATLTAECDPMNLASRRLAERIGMKLVQETSTCLFIKGAWVGSAEYSLSAAEWRGGARLRARSLDRQRTR